MDDFLIGITGKSKLIICLLSTGDYSFDHIRSIKVGELEKLRKTIKTYWPGLIDALDELTRNRGADDYAFLFDSGRRYSSNNIRDILIRAHKRAELKYEGLAAFVKKIQ